MRPLVTAIVTTHGRPNLVGRAIRSVLAQTLGELELCVVQDGRDDATAAAIDAIRDPRLYAVRLPERQGHPIALNVGVESARAPWVAFLDDDDEWLPDKLARQLSTAESSAHAEPVVSCRSVVRSERGEVVWPRRILAPGEPISEYLFCRRSLSFGEGMLLNTTLFASTELVRRHPFDTSLSRHADLDWVLHLARDPKVGFEFAAGGEPLAIWHDVRSHARISGSPDWEFSRRWIEARRDDVTARAYAWFLLTWVAANAVRQGERRALPEIARQAFRHGRPDAAAVLVFLGICGLPQRVRESLSRGFARGNTAGRGEAPAIGPAAGDPRPLGARAASGARR